MNQSYEQQLHVQAKQDAMRREAEHARLAEEARPSQPGLLTKLRDAAVNAAVDAMTVTQSADELTVVEAKVSKPVSKPVRKPIEIQG